MLAKRIIFVHGMGPKPAKEKILAQYRDALRRSLWVDLADDAVSMAYWADLRRRRPLRFRLRGGMFDLFRSRLMKVFARDVYLYFYTDVGDAIRRRLLDELAAAADAAQAVAILSHSMGTVIAYDVLRQSEMKVELLLTIGSPLSLIPIRHELGEAAFPANVHRWLNFYDGLDKVTLPFQEISGTYTLEGARLVVDEMIRENYSAGGKRDAHHWFGYLTSRQVGDAVSQFLIAP